MFRYLLLLTLIIVSSLLMACNEQFSDTEKSNSLDRYLGDDNTAGFKHAEYVRKFSFPQDHGPHPAYRNEWWYFTGNLQTDNGRRFGYELTFFRWALSAIPSIRDSRWATSQVYSAHLTISDIKSDKFYVYERFARGAADLAGAQAQPFKVWLDDWSIRSSSDADFPWRLQAKADGISLDLHLSSNKPVVLQGDRGLSQKSAVAGNASYYYSYTRLQTSGSLTIGNSIHNVSGTSWMDREWGSSVLSDAQAGWDWFALQLEHGYEFMFYRLRNKDGSTDRHSAGSLIDPHGRATYLNSKDVTIQELDRWHSPHGGSYPARWRLQLHSLDLEFMVTPLMAQQELNVSVRYWEGAVAVEGKHAQRPISGYGYVELTGYAHDARSEKNNPYLKYAK